MRRTRIEKPRQPARARRDAEEAAAHGSPEDPSARRYAPGTSALRASLDPRDPDILRAKRLGLRPRDHAGNGGS
ncbi:hypothetical protein [Streptomyces sp. NPDC052012]|uniref:hypothetical protein n=1 Tax=Streptomyces sp. NPDC052012 TaxID=3155051 RepID=UPI00344CA796